MSHLPQLLHHVAHVHRENRSGELVLQVLLQPLGAIHHDLNRLGRLRAEAPPRRLRTPPLRRRLSSSKRRPSPLVERPVQLPIVATPECVHHHNHHFLAVLTLVPLLPTPLLARALASPSRDDVGNRTCNPCECPRFPRRLLNSASVAVGGHLPSTSITNTSPSFRGAAMLLHERHRLPPQAQHQVLDCLGRGRPPQRRPADQPARPVTHPRGQPRHELHHPRRESVPCQAQHRVQRMKPAAALPRGSDEPVRR